MRSIQKNNKKENALLCGPLLPGIVAFAFPYLLSCLLQQLYGLADLFVIGRFESSVQVAAVASGSQLMHMITAVLIGLCTGITVVVSRLAGNKARREMNLCMKQALVLLPGFSCLVTGLVLLVTSSLANWLSVPEEAGLYFGRYIQICAIGLPAVGLFNALSACCRGQGDSKTPMVFVALSCLLNIGLDFLLTGVLGWGSTGVAVATVSAQLICVVLMAWYCFGQLSAHSIWQVETEQERKTVPQGKRGSLALSVLQIGLPIALQDGLIQISFLVILALGNGRGIDDAAAIGVVEKLISFFFLIPSAFSQSLAPVVGMNVGAGQFRRAYQALILCCALSLGWGLVVVVLSWCAGKALVGAFVPSGTVVKKGAEYLAAYSLDALGVAIHFNFGSYFCAWCLPSLSFVQNFLSAVSIRIPLAWLACERFSQNLFWMGLAAPAGSLFQALFCIAAFYCLRSRFLPSRGVSTTIPV